MLKLLIIFVTIFNTINAVQDDSAECLENKVLLDLEFSACCRGKPTFTSDECVEELIKTDYNMTQVCIVECMYKDFKFYNGSHINMSGVKSFFEENWHEQDVRDLFINAFDVCSNLELSKLEQISSIADENCDLYPFYMDQCVWYHTISHCPERLSGGDKEQCQAKTNWVLQCLFT